jgi:hypothetical protein
VAGNTTTDFGAPDILLPGDQNPLSDEELACYTTILKAAWHMLDHAWEIEDQGI